MDQARNGDDYCEAREPQRIVTIDERLEARCPGTPTTEVQRNPKIRTINIDQLDLGYVVRVGCQSFAIETSEKLVSAMVEYLNHPNETEIKWFEGKFLK